MNAPEAGVRKARVFLETLAFAQRPLRPGARVLDLGCGSGAMVESLRAHELEAQGADIAPHWRSAGRSDEGFSLISLTPYQLPYPDESFDAVVSEQVFEHVRDHRTVLKELSRVLRPGGVSLHVYPARLAPIERHTFVPFAGVVRFRWYLQAWAALGVRNSFQKRDAAAAITARENRRYLDEETNYLPCAQMRRLAEPFFDVRFVERELLLASPGRCRALARIPFGPLLYRHFRMRALLLVKPDAVGTKGRS